MRIERRARRSLRPEPIGELPSDDARRDDDRREDEEHRPGAVHSELARVERGERAEAGEAEDGHGEDEPGRDRSGVDEPRDRQLPVDPCRRGLREREPDRRCDETEAGCKEPDGVEAITVEHELAEKRADREPAPETEAVEAQRLTSTFLGREVGDHRRRADEEHRLADAGEQAKRDQDLERVRERVGGDAGRADEPAGDDQDATTLAVPDASRDRLEQEEHRAHGRDGEGDPEAPGAELVVRVHRQDHEQHPDRHAHRELRENGEHEGPRQDAIGLHVTDPSRSSRSRLSTGTVRAEPNLCPMSANEAALRAQGRREAAPAAIAVLIVLVALAIVSRSQLWELLGLPWWIWLVLGIPALLLAIDLLLALRGKGLVQSRKAALVLLGLLAFGNFVALGILVAGLVTASSSDLSGGELLLTGFAIYTTDVVVFGLVFWEVEAGGPVARQLAPERGVLDFRFPQDDSPAERVEAAGLGLPLRVPDELDRVQPDRHHAPFSASESADGPRVVRLCRDGLTRRSPCR